MAYGAEFYNANGNLQLGAGVTNFRQVASGTINDPYAAPLVTPGNGITFDIIAVRSNNCFPAPIAPFSTPQSSARISVYGSQGQSFTYHCFRSYSSMTPSTSGYGLEIYNADGTVGFSSLEPNILRTYAKIPISSGVGFNVTLPSDRTFAFIAYGKVSQRKLIRNKELYVSSVPTIQNYSGGVHVASNFWIDSSDSFESVFNGGVIAVDVTGY
jgi:hypothetical protein